MTQLKTKPKFFDCACEFGPHRNKIYRYAKTADELLAEMDFCNIERALVFHTGMRYDLPMNGNERLMEEIQGHPRLIPSWTILPSHTNEQPCGEALIPLMRQHNVRALRMFPNEHRYFMDAMTWGDQLEIYAERRIPLFIRVRVDELIDLLNNFPRLIIVTGAHGFNPIDRFTWPLVEKYPNLHLETSSYLIDGALEEFCRRHGASRLIFGTGYPENSAGSSMLHLTHAEISDADREAIANENLARILAEVNLS